MFRIEYSPAAVAHFAVLTARQQRSVMDAVDEQLGHQPDVENRNRKPMRPNPVAPWELRIGQLRVYYDLDLSRRRVLIRAIGSKERNQVKIGKEVIQL